MPSRNAADRTPNAPFLLRLALRAYPRVDRDGYGDELLEAALELSAAGSSIRREAAGLIAGGLQARGARARLGLAAVDLRAGLDRSCLPTAMVAVLVWSIAAVARITGARSGDPGVAGPTVGSLWLLFVLALLVVSVARRHRTPAVAAAILLATQVAASAVWSSARGGTVTAAPLLHLHLGAWWFGPSLAWSALPFALLLVPATWALHPPAPRVPGLRRPWRERAWARLLAIVTPALVVGLVLTVAPRLLVEGGAIGETTEIAGIVLLMLVVASLWLATSPLVTRPDDAVAGALIGLATIPSIAYGGSRLLLSPIGDVIRNRELLVGTAILLAGLFVVLAIAAFVLVIAQVGLRALDRRGGSALAVGHAIPLGPESH